MPQRDIYHQAVRVALEADGWTITHDPYPVRLGIRRGYVDLGAHQPIAAELNNRKIAVEIKSFISVSPVTDLSEAIGQYVMYRSWISRSEPERELFLAVDTDVATSIFGEIAGAVLIHDYAIKLLVVDVVQERIAEWRP